VAPLASMTNILSDAKTQQVIALGQLGWTLRRIEQATGVRRETASAYLKAAGLAVRPPGRWGHPPANPAKGVSTDPDPALATPNPASEVSADLRLRPPGVTGPPTWPPPGRAPAASACEPYRDLIEIALARGRDAMAIYRDLVDDHGFPAHYASVRRFVLKLRGQRPAEAHPVIVTGLGEEGQVDYTQGPMVRHPVTRKYRRTRLFVFTLGYSRKCVRLLTFASSTRRWAELHEEAFRRLGGSVRVVVLDNLKEGVLKPDIYDPTLNPLYRDLLAHYGAVALPCRVRDPDRKGKVESAIDHTQGALKGLRFEALEAGQAYLDRWDTRWADTRIHGTTKRQVAAMFAEERPALQPLPLEPFRYYQFGTRTVHLDGAVEVEYAYYPAPPGWLGHEVRVQWDGVHVRLLDPATGTLLREHRRQAPGRRASSPEDRPPHTPPTTLTLLAQATRAGAHIGTLCETIHRRDGEAGVRRILGVLSLVKTHGPAGVEDACAAALECEVATYRFVRRYLERHPAAPLTLRQVDPLIRDLTHYRDLIARKTQEEIPT
jgi:transposase